MIFNCSNSHLISYVMKHYMRHIAYDFMSYITENNKCITLFCYADTP